MRTCMLKVYRINVFFPFTPSPSNCMFCTLSLTLTIMDVPLSIYILFTWLINDIVYTLKIDLNMTNSIFCMMHLQIQALGKIIELGSFWKIIELGSLIKISFIVSLNDEIESSTTFHALNFENQTTNKHVIGMFVIVQSKIRFTL